MKVLRRPVRDQAPEPLAERGRGRRRLALVVPAVAVVCGLVAGGLAGERVVGRRRAAVIARPAGAAVAPRGTIGPVEQLRGAGILLFTDQQGRAHAQAADGSGHRLLGQLGDLATRRGPSGFEFETAALMLSAPPDDRPADRTPTATWSTCAPPTAWPPWGGWPTGRCGAWSRPAGSRPGRPATRPTGAWSGCAASGSGAARSPQ